MTTLRNLDRKKVSSTGLPICVVCGAETEWDFDLGDQPLCTDCWDELDEGVAEYIPYDTVPRSSRADKQRAYREAHRDEIADRKRAYYEAHRDEIAAQQRAYREAHRDEIADKKRARGIDGRRRPFNANEDGWILYWRDREGWTFAEIGEALARTMQVVRARYLRLKASRK